jgi:hypothetical protein
MMAIVGPRSNSAISFDNGATCSTELLDRRAKKIYESRRRLIRSSALFP